MASLVCGPDGRVPKDPSTEATDAPACNWTVPSANATRSALDRADVATPPEERSTVPLPDVVGFVTTRQTPDVQMTRAANEPSRNVANGIIARTNGLVGPDNAEGVDQGAVHLVC